jgi:hypothetical protein
METVVLAAPNAQEILERRRKLLRAAAQACRPEKEIPNGS